VVDKKCLRSLAYDMVLQVMRLTGLLLFLNSLHWVLDVTFREDDCRMRKDHAPQNFSALRKFALALLRNDSTYPKRGLRSRRKTADRVPQYRASLPELLSKSQMPIALIQMPDMNEPGL
jgi:hypothetical protein